MKALSKLGFFILVTWLVLPFAVTAAQEVPQSREQISLSFSPLVKSAAPAVVNIYTKTVVQTRKRNSPFAGDPFFDRFFGDGFGFGQPRERVKNSLGSGVILDPSGIVVTNFHVIRGATEIRVALNDRREFSAEVILLDERTDMAFLKLDVEDHVFPFLELRDSDTIEVGDLVLAIGNPFGVGQTVTSGIVSALARTGIGVNDYSFFIQTDAAINPGNSGGALVTLDGKLAGVNTAIYSRSGGSNGIGFAIPSSMVKVLFENAKHGKAIVRPWLGLEGQVLTSDLAQGLGIGRSGGVIITRVHPNSPAAVAGLDKGDVILALDGQEVLDTQAFRFRLGTKSVGAIAVLTVWKDRVEQDVVLELIAPPETILRKETKIEGRSPFTGATVVSLSPAVSEEMELFGEWEGVAVVSVERGSPAAYSRFRESDLILSVNGVQIETVADLVDIANRALRQWEITYKRAGRVLKIRLAF
ncbi:Do family serine endopeptidase [Alphaproteobacteria bacterium]|nr:Do family serine endopeptidase [Alphaproteobacteria bacterium]